jgi:type II secretory pathway component GspD/PulD (secretin)
VKAVAGAIERGDVVQRRLEETLRVLRDLELTPVQKVVVAHLRQTRMTLEIKRQPFREVVEFLRQFTNMNFVFDASPANDSKMTLTVQNLPMENVLNLITDQVGCAWVIEDGYIQFTSEENVKSRRWILARKYGDRRVDPKDPDVVAMQNKLDNLKVDINLHESRFEDAVDFLRSFAGMNIVLDRAVLEDESVLGKKVTIQSKDLVLSNCLKLIFAQYDLEWGFRERVVYVTKKEPGK